MLPFTNGIDRFTSLEGMMIEGFLGVVVPAVAVVGAVDIDEFWLLLLFRLRSTAFDRLWHEDEDEDNDDKDEDEDLEDFRELQVSDEFNE